jgi:DnaJ-class molecular chaperone
MRDPYEILGVQRSATAADVKSAFRKLAKKLHPDANTNDSKAASRFAELNAAYEILGDEDKRKAFDRGEIDGEGKPRFQGFGGGGARPGAGAGPAGGFESFSWGADAFQRAAGARGGRGFGGIEDVLKEMFSGGLGGAARGARTPFEPEDVSQGGGQDVTASLTITLAEAAAGARKRVSLPTGKSIEVKVPVGLADGQQIRLKGQGGTGRDGTRGDALITIKIAPDPVFTRDGADLRLDLSISLYEAVLGGKVRVPTLDGAVELAIPAGTSSGRTFRLKGKGMPEKQGAGDLLVAVRIVLPERTDPELEQAMRALRDNRPYNPRAS